MLQSRQVEGGWERKFLESGDFYLNRATREDLYDKMKYETWRRWVMRIFIEFLLYAKPCSSYWDYNSESLRQGFYSPKIERNVGNEKRK